ncbi:MAG: hypothetical protein AAGF12_17125 [Myxococcota bacterium]
MREKAVREKAVREKAVREKAVRPGKGVRPGEALALVLALALLGPLVGILVSRWSLANADEVREVDSSALN